MKKNYIIYMIVFVVLVISFVFLIHKREKNKSIQLIKAELEKQKFERHLLYERAIQKADSIMERMNQVFVDYNVESWIGKRFVFMPQRKIDQKYGYEAFGDNYNRNNNSVTPKVKYHQYVNRTAKVISMKEPEFGYWNINFKMEDNGQILQARYVHKSGDIKGMTFVEDIDNARKMWLGKTLWYMEGKIFSYDENNDKIQNIKVKNCSAVEVTDVNVGWDNEKPVRFFLKTSSGESGFIDINLSGTNDGFHLKIDQRYKFNRYFLTYDPRIKYDWSDSVWAAIEDEKVFIGMTSEQAQLSWDKPYKINTTTTVYGNQEQWVYGSNCYLYFDNGVLSSIQNSTTR